MPLEALVSLAKHRRPMATVLKRLHCNARILHKHANNLLLLSL